VGKTGSLVVIGRVLRVDDGASGLKEKPWVIVLWGRASSPPRTTEKNDTRDTKV
jgi:hypothetical protein